jgi:hypothetical protein
MRSFSRQRFCTTPFHCQRRATRRSQQLNPKHPCEKDVIVVFKNNTKNCWEHSSHKVTALWRWVKALSLIYQLTLLKTPLRVRDPDEEEEEEEEEIY